MRTSIRFKNQALSRLRERLLEDLSHEYFAALLAKQETIGDLRVLNVLDIRYPKADAYEGQGEASLRVSFDSFMSGVLSEIDERLDVDTVIDVHTHPFSEGGVRFSSIDDADECGFTKYLEPFGIGYASIVLSQTEYSARWWELDKEGNPCCETALVKTQKASEQISSSNERWGSMLPGAAISRFKRVDQLNQQHKNSEIDVTFDRSVRALGLEGMRAIASAQTITVVGVGGLGSVIAEHLVHMGFSNIALVDFDRLEMTNMNRIVGATYADAETGRLKVEAVQSHLLSINPKAHVEAVPSDVFDEKVEAVIADSDWVLVATDNHASRFHVQELCFKYFVPFITAGVNITVENGRIEDMSGESILVRMGDRVCLSCLGRVNFNEIAKERHPDPAVREGLVAKGYVTGEDVKEPAVKTLNTHLATIAVDTLVNQYTERRRDAVVMVYEDNNFPSIYEDKYSTEHRCVDCSVCGF